MPAKLSVIQREHVLGDVPTHADAIPDRRQRSVARPHFEEGDLAVKRLVDVESWCDDGFVRARVVLFCVEGGGGGSVVRV